MDRSIFKQLEDIQGRYDELDLLLSDPQTIKDTNAFQRYAKERSSLNDVVEIHRQLKSISRNILQNKELLDEEDKDIRELAREEIKELEQQKAQLEEKARALLLPRDPNDEKNIFIEIRAGTGGEEAGLFAADLFRMYVRFAEKNSWKVDIVSQHPTGVGGFKEIIALIEGKRVFSKLKYESGVHRVQRVPTTESQGRIHTSAVTVAILPEAEDVEVKIDPNDLRVDVFRSSGPGGQSVNTTDSAVRITHIPTGIVVTCQDEKSQHKNKAKALRVVKARLLNRMKEEQQVRLSQKRRVQVGSGDRSERIRTYNFPQGRVTDHRIGLTLHKLEEVLEGDLTEIIEALAASEQVETLKEQRDLTSSKGDLS